MKAITVLFPIYNEELWLQKEFSESWQFLNSLEAHVIEQIHFRFCLWSDTSETTQNAAKSSFAAIMQKLPAGLSWDLCIGSDKTPSVVASLQLGFVKNLPSKFALLCPIDCALTTRSLQFALEFTATSKTNLWAIFRKSYTSRNVFLSTSQFFQNYFVVPFLKTNCWTNLFLIPTDVFAECFERSLFLEDLNANKCLRKKLGNPNVLKASIRVSARRYLKRGSFRQIKANILIYLRYTFLPRQELALKRLHDGAPNAQKGVPNL